MAKDGLFALACALAIAVAGPGLSLVSAGPDDRDLAVTAALAVQMAIQQGRDYLQRDDPRSAVFVLEGQLGRINGNPTYMALMRDAYRAMIKKLKHDGDTAEAQRYQQRLQIIDP